MMYLVFRHPDMPPSLNGNDGLMRMHWSKRKKVKEKFMWLIKQQGTEKFGDDLVSITLVNHYSNTPMDWENLASRLKVIGDSLKALGCIKDDNPNIVKDFEMRQVKVKTRKEAKLEFFIIRRHLHTVPHQNNP